MLEVCTRYGTQAIMHSTAEPTISVWGDRGRLQHLRQKYLHATIAILLCVSIFYIFRRLALSFDENATHRHGSHDTAVEQSLPDGDVSILETLQVQHPFEFRRSCIQPRKQKSLGRQALVNVPHDLFTSASVSLFEAGGVAKKLPPCATRIDVSVPSFDRFATEGTEVLLLGIATKLSRLGGSLVEIRRWLAHTHTRLVILLVDVPDLEAERHTLVNLHGKAAELKIEIVLYSYLDTEDSLSTIGKAGISIRSPLLTW